MVVEGVIEAGVNASQFGPALSVELLAKGILDGIRGGRIRVVIETLKKVQGLGISLSVQFDSSAMELLGKECCQIVTSGQVEEAVESMEVLARNSFVTCLLLILVMYNHLFCMVEI